MVGKSAEDVKVLIMKMCDEEEKLDAIIARFTDANVVAVDDAEAVLERLIKCIDTDADGNLSRAELSRFMKEVVGERDDAEDMCQELGDGEKIPADTLRSLMRKLWAEDPEKLNE